MLQRLGDHGTTGTRIGRRAAVLAVFVAALWTCFLAAPVDNPTDMFTRDYGHEPLVAAYLLVSLTYLALALIDVIRGTMQIRPRRRRRPRPRTAPDRHSAAGSASATSPSRSSSSSGSSPETATAGSTLESTTARLLAVGGGLLVIAGSTLPFLATRTTRARTWATTYRNLRRLYPLWELMYRATPGIALDPPRSALADALRLRDLDLRLYRRIIEIRDGRLALTPYLDPTPDLSDHPDDAAAVEATALRAAVERQRRNDPVSTAPPAQHCHRDAARSTTRCSGSSASPTTCAGPT